MKVDLHTHILPPTWPDLRERFGCDGFVHLEHDGPGCARMMIGDRLFREITDNCWNPVRRIEECARQGVGLQVLSTVPVMFNYWAKPEHGLDLSRLLNDHLAEVVRRHPEHFAGLGTLPMQAPELAVRELERCVTELGLRGVQIGSHVNQWELGDPALFPVFEAAQKLGAAVFVHPWDMVGKERTSKYWLGWLVGMPAETALAVCSLLFSGTLERLPRLRVCFAHGGGAFPGILGRIAHGFDVRPDLCAVDNARSPRDYLGRFWVDSLVHDADALRTLLRLVGERRIVLGSDYPFPLGEDVPGTLIESMPDLAERTRELLLRDNALEFLGLCSTAALSSESGDRGCLEFRETPCSPEIGAAYALEQDRLDPLAGFRERFNIPPGLAGQPCVYLCGNSLGLQPKGVRPLIEQELDDWAKLGVEGHFCGRSPWYGYHEQFRETGARLVGALPGEVVMMNSLTVNLHLMMATFYRPAGSRTKLLIDEPAFPSDLYATASQVRHHGLDPAEHLLTIAPQPGEHLLREEDVEALLAERGGEIALCLFNGVNFLTGQFLDVARLTRAAHAAGCLVGWDLAHAAGNVVLKLHEWDVDFAAWCSYKYLNAGPGAVAGVFVHQRHGDNLDLPRLAGWWGNDPATRFRMQRERTFVPRAGAEGWQVSNPPILALAPLRASLDLFDEAGMEALRAKSEKLTGYLEWLLERLPTGSVEVISPREPSRRGCQLSLRVPGGRAALERLERAGIVCDFREPDVLRVAPVPLYNTFHDVWRFVEASGAASARRV